MTGVHPLCHLKLLLAVLSKWDQIQFCYFTYKAWFKNPSYLFILTRLQTLGDLYVLFTLLEAMWDTDRWVWIVSSWSRHQSSSSRVSRDIRRNVSSAKRRDQMKTTIIECLTSQWSWVKAGRVWNLTIKVLAWLGGSVMKVSQSGLTEACSSRVPPRSEHQTLITLYRFITRFTSSFLFPINAMRKMLGPLFIFPRLTVFHFKMKNWSFVTFWHFYDGPGYKLLSAFYSWRNKKPRTS